MRIAVHPSLALSNARWRKAGSGMVQSFGSGSLRGLFFGRPAESFSGGEAGSEKGG